MTETSIGRRAGERAGGLEAAARDLAERFSGELLAPTHPAYDAARRVHNGLVDKHPALIARCRGTADVVHAVRFAREHGLEVAVRGGGHNVSGRATVNDGLMIDLSLMKGVRVDPQRQTARAQCGLTWRELDLETQRHGLATTGGEVSSTGISGLTLGGGYGWLQAKYGLAADNLLSAEIVTADGRALTASDDEHPDLFWAIRGGGGNFGVAASLEYRLHRVGPLVTGGMVAHPFERARDVLRFFREFAESLPDELTSAAGLVHAPDGSGVKLAAIIACHCGQPRDGEAAVRPVRQFGRPAVDVIGPMPYTAVNAMLDGGFPKGALNYWKSSFLAGLDDDAIDALVAAFARCPSPMSFIVIEELHGAATRVPVTATAIPHRRQGFNCLIISQWASPADTGRCTDWARESYAALEPFMAPSRYVNYLDDDEAGDPVAAAYGVNYPRLKAIKARYDPENVFHLNQNIRPAR